jgi:EmrB/QacA subfamily drug resistance transporter
MSDNRRLADPAQVLAHDAPPSLSRRQIVALMGGLMTGILLAALDQTIVGTALPTIVGKLGGLSHYSWVVTGYLVASTASTPLYGKVSDLYGRRPVYSFAITTFLVGSLLAGLSQNMTELIATRAVQGLGAGGLLTLAFTIVSDVMAPRERAKYQGIFGSMFGLASIAGPLVGGYFAQHDWRWIFYVNVPLAIVALVVCDRVLRLVPHRRREHTIDWLGAVLMVGAVVSLLLALSFGGSAGWAWTSVRVIGLFVASAVLAAGFLYVERRAVEPVLPLRLFRSGSYSLANAATFVLGFSMFGAIIFVPLYLQIVKGATPTRSGLLMLPMMGGLIVTSIVSGRLISRVGHYKWFTVAGSGVVAVGLAGFGLLPGGEAPNGFVEYHAGAPLWRVDLYMLVIGVGMGLSMQPLILAAQNALDPKDMGIGTSFVTFFRALGGSVGVAALGAVLSNQLVAKLKPLLTDAIGKLDIDEIPTWAPKLKALSLNDPQTIQKMPAPIRDAIQYGFIQTLRPVFLLAAAVSLIAVVICIALPDRELRGAPAARTDARTLEDETTTDVRA